MISCKRKNFSQLTTLLTFRVGLHCTRNKHMHDSHHKTVLNTVYEYESYGVTCCFCVSEMVINKECEKPISRKVSLNESALNATQTVGTVSVPRLKPTWTAVSYFLNLFVSRFLFPFSLWVFFLISTSSFYLSPAYLSH
jgi:hypothetical protein